MQETRDSYVAKKLFHILDNIFFLFLPISTLLCQTHQGFTRDGKKMAIPFCILYTELKLRTCPKKSGYMVTLIVGDKLLLEYNVYKVSRVSN